jgi:hypothetical protein
MMTNNNNVYKFYLDFVIRCDSLKEMLKGIKSSIDSHKPMDLLIEEYYEGCDIDIDILIQNNEIRFMSISDNFPPIEPWFFEQGKIEFKFRKNLHI